MDEATRSVARAGPGPVYDAMLRWLVENDPVAMCRLLGEEPLQPPVLLSESLPVGTVYPDALLQIAPGRLLHTEFVRRVDADLGLRMLEYRARILRKHRGMSLGQHILVLADGTVPDPLGDGDCHLRVHVTYLRDLDVQGLLADPSLAPLAVLGRATDETARRLNFEHSLDVIGRREPNRRRAGALLDAAAILARVRLDSDTIKESWKGSYMNVITQAEFDDLLEAFRPKNEQDRLEWLEYQKYREPGRFLRTLLIRRFGYVDRLGPVSLALARDFELDDALDLLESADSFEALEAKL